jgi:NADH:ubiquinone oxidoreductase subunit 6 (subunit J)
LRVFLVLLVCGLGFWAVSCLLPQARKQPVFSAVVAGVAALAVGALTLAPSGPDVPFAQDLLFCIFAGMAIVAGVLLITQHNPVYAALWFAVVVLSTCGLFLLQSAPFLAAATIIVYAGAIIVTFLFVIMLAQQSGLAVYDRRSREPFLASLGGFVLLAALLYALSAGYASPQAPGSVTERRAALQSVLAVIDDATARLQAGETVDSVAKRLYTNPQNPDTTIGNVLYQLTEGLPHTERSQRRAALEAIVNRVGSARVADNPAQMTAALADLRAVAVDLQLQLQGSPLSREPASDHVAAVGQSLFADYLWAVELAGTLLLVATIGAVIIAGRRKEGTL